MPGAQVLLVFCPEKARFINQRFTPVRCVLEERGGQPTVPAPYGSMENALPDVPHRGIQIQRGNQMVNNFQPYCMLLFIFSPPRNAYAETSISESRFLIASNSACRASAWLFKACFSHSGSGCEYGAAYLPNPLRPGKPVAKNRWRHPLPPPATPRLRPNPNPKPRTGATLAKPDIPIPAQYPAEHPVIGPIPEGPVLSPLGIIAFSFPLIVLSFSFHTRDMIAQNRGHHVRASLCGHTPGTRRNRPDRPSGRRPCGPLSRRLYPVPVPVRRPFPGVLFHYLSA
jgi:hypothetical protein